MIPVRANLRLPKIPAGWLIGGVSLLVVLAVAVLLGVPRAAPANPPDVAALPRLNAALNGASALLLSAAYVFIRRRQVRWHRACMLAAFTLSGLFLLSYVIYHALAGARPFAGPAALRPFYFAVLTSHVVLAAAVLPLALTTLYRARRGTFAAHRRIARFTLPLWLYVSVSGVVVYWLLYQVR